MSESKSWLKEQGRRFRSEREEESEVVEVVDVVGDMIVGLAGRAADAIVAAEAFHCWEMSEVDQRGI